MATKPSSRQLVTLFNRFKDPVSAMFDGVVYTVDPGERLTLQVFVARHLRSKSVFLDNPISGEKSYKLGIVEDGDDDTPLSEVPIEALDRSDMDFSKVRIVTRNAKPVVPPKENVVNASVGTPKERGA